MTAETYPSYTNRSSSYSFDISFTCSLIYIILWICILIQFWTFKRLYSLQVPLLKKASLIILKQHSLHTALTKQRKLENVHTV